MHTSSKTTLTRLPPNPPPRPSPPSTTTAPPPAGAPSRFARPICPMHRHSKGQFGSRPGPRAWKPDGAWRGRVKVGSLCLTRLGNRYNVWLVPGRQEHIFYTNSNCNAWSTCQANHGTRSPGQASFPFPRLATKQPSPKLRHNSRPGKICRGHKPN